MHLIAWQDLNPSIIAWIKQKLTFEEKNFQNPEKPIIRQYFYEQPEGLLVPLYFAVEHGYWKPPSEKKQWMSINLDLKVSGELQETSKRPQKTAFQAVFKKWETSPCTLLVMPCGSGKTNTAIHIAVKAGFQTLILCHNDYLLNQWKERLLSIVPGVQIGRMQQKTDVTEGMDFVLCSIPSLVSRDYSQMEFGLIIIDEAHHISAMTYHKILCKLKYRYALGLTATPQLGVEGAIKYLLGPPATTFTSQSKHYIQVNMIKYTATKQREIKYKSGVIGFTTMVKNLCNDQQRNIFIVRLLQHLHGMHPGYQGLVLSHQCLHLNKLSKLLTSAGVPHHISCGSINRQLGFHPFLTLSTFKHLSEAIDFPGNYMLFATPRSQVEQCAGRIDRGKTDPQPVLFDIWDPYSIFQMMGLKRFHYYKKHQYSLIHVPEEKIPALKKKTTCSPS